MISYRELHYIVATLREEGIFTGTYEDECEFIDLLAADVDRTYFWMEENITFDTYMMQARFLLSV